MKYDVHLFYAVRIKVSDVEAESQAEAIKKADQELDLEGCLWRRSAVSDEGGYLGALVDEVGDEDYRGTAYHVGPGARNYLEEMTR